VAVYYDEVSGFDVTGHVTTHGGTGGGGAGAVGTVYLKLTDGEGVLRVDSHGAAAGQWTPLGIPSDARFSVDRLVLSGAGVVAAPEHQMAIEANNVDVLSGAVLTHRVTTAAQEYSLLMTVTGTLTVDSASSIDVSSRGYRQGYTLGNTQTGGAWMSAGAVMAGWGISRAMGLRTGCTGTTGTRASWGQAEGWAIGGTVGPVEG